MTDGASGGLAARGENIAATRDVKGRLARLIELITMSQETPRDANGRKPDVIVEYTREDAISDGVLVPTGLVGYKGGKFVQVCFTGRLFADFKDATERNRLVEEGLRALRRSDPEDTRHRLLRVLRGKYWVILDGDGITFLYPENY